MVWKKRIFAIATLALLVVILSGLMVSPALGQQPERVKVLIGFTHQPGPAEEALVRGVGGTIKYTYHLVPAIAATLPEAAIPGLLANPNVTRIEPDGQVWAIEAELDNTWGVKRIGAGVVHGYNKGTGVKVAIIDTGIDYKHSDLDANYEGGWDFVNKDADPMDDNGHGTHVAGTVAAEDNDVGVVGVAPEAQLYALKVLGSDGGGYYSDVIAALQWAVDNGMRVTNNSYGSSGDPGVTVKQAFDNAYYSKGVLNVCAAGNSGNPPGKGDNVIYPARYESCIAVAATDQSDKRASWSSTGPAVELAAPGVSINSTVPGGGYAAWSGTSMASPHVAGTAALVMVAYPLWTNKDVRTQLQNTADDLGVAGRDTKYGYGLVDADEAAPQPVDVHDVAVTDIAAPSWVVAGDQVSVDVTVENQGTYEESFTVTLTDTTPEPDVLIGSKDVILLAAGAPTTLSFTWDTTGATTGDHVLEAVASTVTGETDTADNSLTATVTVKEPSHDVAVTAIDAPSPVGQGDTVVVDVTVENQGTYDESFTVTLMDTTPEPDVLIGSEDVILLAAGTSTTLSFTWDTTDASPGDHVLKAEASVVAGETDTTDNVKTATVNVVEKKALYVAIALSDPPYTRGETLYIRVTVTENDATGPAVNGATVHITILTPKPISYGWDQTTAANGVTVFEFKPKWSGDYSTKADATYGGSSGSSVWVPFTVK